MGSFSNSALLKALCKLCFIIVFPLWPGTFFSECAIHAFVAKVSQDFGAIVYGFQYKVKDCSKLFVRYPS